MVLFGMVGPYVLGLLPFAMIRTWIWQCHAEAGEPLPWHVFVVEILSQNYKGYSDKHRRLADETHLDELMQGQGLVPKETDASIRCVLGASTVRYRRTLQDFESEVGQLHQHLAFQRGLGGDAALDQEFADAVLSDFPERLEWRH